MRAKLAGLVNGSISVFWWAVCGGIYVGHAVAAR
jgi:hypothetical protein